MFAPAEEIDGALQELRHESRAGWPGAAQSALVVELAHITERANAELLRAVGQWDAEGLWAEDGAASAASWLAANTAMTRAEANRLVRSARLLREHEATAAAVASGAISCTQIDTLATVTRNREDLYPEGEDALLTAAEALSADDFAAVARHWRSLADDALATEDAYAIHERRYVHASKTLFGRLRIDAELDADGGETFLAALAAGDAADPGDREPDGRTGGQRNADNLVQMAAAYLAGGASHARPEISTSVVIDLDTLVGARVGACTRPGASSSTSVRSHRRPRCAWRATPR